MRQDCSNGVFILPGGASWCILTRAAIVSRVIGAKGGDIQLNFVFCFDTHLFLLTLSATVHDM